LPSGENFGWYSRSFESFSEAAEENGLSRILIGIHFRDAVEQGIQHGRRIGSRAVNLFLKPVTRKKSRHER
jgi:hypothetical protein